MRPAPSAGHLSPGALAHVAALAQSGGSLHHGNACGMILFSAHALLMLVERAIDREWVERAVMAPDAVEPDGTHPDRIRALGIVPERGGRVLRVVCVVERGDIRVVTAFLDRSRRGTP